MIPEVSANISKSEAYPQSKLNAHEVYSELSSLLLQNKSNIVKTNSSVSDTSGEVINDGESITCEQIKSLIIQYAYRGCNIAYSN